MYTSYPFEKCSQGLLLTVAACTLPWCEYFIVECVEALLFGIWAESEGEGDTTRLVCLFNGGVTAVSIRHNHWWGHLAVIETVTLIPVQNVAGQKYM